ILLLTWRGINSRTVSSRTLNARPIPITIVVDYRSAPRDVVGRLDRVDEGITAAGAEMTVPILVCDCGMRMRAPGAVPGRVGRCPQCGGRLRVPDEFASPKAKRLDEEEPAAGGYRLEPDDEAPARNPA